MDQRGILFLRESNENFKRARAGTFISYGKRERDRNEVSILIYGTCAVSSYRRFFFFKLEYALDFKRVHRKII